MGYEKITTKILGEHTEREGEVASLVLDFVAKNPDWERDKEPTLYEDEMIKIIDLVICQLYHRPLEYYFDKSREADKVEVRQMVCLFLRENTPYTLHKIAHIVNRDHSTVVWSVKTARDRVQMERPFRENYETFKNSCLERL